MSSRQFTQFILGLVFLVSSGFAYSNTELTYNISEVDNSLEITGCEGSCPNILIIPEQIDGHTVTSIGEAAFIGQQYFDTFSLPSTITSIGGGAFFETGLPYTPLPDSIKHIGDAAFYLSFAISGQELPHFITFPEEVETIGEASFYNNGFRELYFLGNRPDIHQEAFIGNDIERISYRSGASGWPGDPINGVTPIENSSCGNNTEFDYTIEYPAVSIDGYTFCTGDLIIPESIDGYEVKKIGVNAFELSNLASVTISVNVEEIGAYAFHRSTVSTLNFLGDRPSFNEGMSYIGDMPSLEIVTYCPNTEGWPGYSINGITPELSEDCDNSSNQSESTQYATFDIDQNGSVGALSDGLILLRYFFNLRGEALIANVIAEDATRTSAADIETYIESHMP
jgi:hypothetical protein